MSTVSGHTDDLLQENTPKRLPLDLFTERDKPAEIDQLNPIEKISTLFYIRPEPIFKIESHIS